jgi:cytoskeletal protein CcmA (bactofilin family)
MADTNTPGSLLVGEGVFMKGSMRVPGLATIDGKLEGELTADTVHIQTNGSMNGRTTASHVRVAGAVTDTTIANKTLVIESSGLIAGCARARAILQRVLKPLLKAGRDANVRIYVDDMVLAVIGNTAEEVA